MKIIYVLVVIACFSLMSEETKIYAQNNEKTTLTDIQEKSGIDKLLTAEEQEILKKADKLELLLIAGFADESGSLEKPENQKLNEIGRFHGYKVTKTVVITKAEDKQTISENLFLNIGKSQLKRCFEPRHGIRATYKDKIIEFLICFQCSHIYAFNGKGYTLDSISENGLESLSKFIKDPKD